MSLKEQIQLAEQKLASVMSTQNGKSVAELYTHDARFLPDGAPTLKGRAEIASFFDGIFRKGIVAGAFTTLEVDGDESAATEIGEYQLFAQSPEGQRVTAMEGRYLVTWKCTDGVWLLHRDVVSRDKSDD